MWFTYDSTARALRSAVEEDVEAARSGAQSSAALALQLSENSWCPARLANGAFGRIEIRRLGILALIAEGTEPAQLERAVGHIATSVFPGQSGNCGLAGHPDSFLLGLGGVLKDDIIRIDTLQDTYIYLVEWGKVVGPHRVDVLDATTDPSLTLVIGYPFDAAGAAPGRFVVRARLVEPMAVMAP